MAFAKIGKYVAYTKKDGSITVSKPKPKKKSKKPSAKKKGK